MDIKEFRKLVNYYSEVCMLQKEPIKVEVTSGLKSSSYFLPPVRIGGIESFKRNLAWFVEIFINDRCIFRQFRLYKGKDREHEQDCINSLVEEIFAGGIDASRVIIEKNINSNE